MVAKATPTPDLRVLLSRALCIRLAELDCRPSVTVRLCSWLALLPDAIERIDQGECFVLVCPTAHVQQLYSLSEAQVAAKQHPMPGMVAVDLRPVLAWLRENAGQI